MTPALVLLVLLVIIVALGVAYSKRSARHRHDDLADARAETRRWIERLGGQVYNLQDSTDPAAKQAVADACERYIAAGAQLDRADTTQLCQLAAHPAIEGLYYVRAARTALGLTSGPELPDLEGRRTAGAVDADRTVPVQGRDVAAAPNPSARTRHYYPGGIVAGRPVPRGWYSEPWWKPALQAGAWSIGSTLVSDALFTGMSAFGMDGDAGDRLSIAGGDAGHGLGGDVADCQ
ncbi:MAG: hypothetical protein ACRDRL_16845 [Sciscionella sp.]